MEKKEINENCKNINSKFCIFLSIIVFIIASVFAYKAYDVKNNYYSSDKNYSLNKNAYVGGDAYNYIINSGYFSGYLSFSGSLYIVSSLLYIYYKKTNNNS